ncbi:hypothetical protein PHET_11350 [Paragonimus heterotremus]|uniref:Uncharacterized protein n=1 Tax=Paragonimus heterotremus TaxID=100268 RepID=A0A8J4SFY3_9TREM|nr:hypothetical protein PHET_11350 [Paragonimus heterotremus]
MRTLNRERIPLLFARMHPNLESFRAIGLLGVWASFSANRYWFLQQ